MGNECSSTSGSCGSGAHAQGAKPASSVRTVTKEQLRDKLQRGGVQVVNVLDPKWYELGFIKGSLKIPVKEIDQRAGELDKSKEVVTYCASIECGASKEGAEKFAAKGFNVSAYEGGIKEWKQAGYPVEEKKGSGSSCCGGTC